MPVEGNVYKNTTYTYAPQSTHWTASIVLGSQHIQVTSLEHRCKKTLIPRIKNIQRAFYVTFFLVKNVVDI